MSDSRQLLRSVSGISLATMMSRILGLLRDQVQSYFFGAGMVTDAYLAAFRIPNLLRDLFAEGALSSAFVPTFTREREHRGDEAAFRLARRLMTWLAVVLGVLTVVILLFARGILKLYVPGFEGEKLELAAQMTRIVSPFLLFVALAAVAMGMLNTHGKFFLPALAPASFNLAAILAVLTLVPLYRALDIHPGLALATGAIVGGLLQFGVQIPALRATGFRFRPDFSWRDAGLKRIGRLMLPATFGLAATQINILVDTILASAYAGAITWLSLAFRLMQLPIGLFGVAIATANLARVSVDAARGDTEGLKGNLAASLRTAALLTLPATAGLIALREPIVRMLFEHGRFDAGDTRNTALAVLCYAVGLAAYSVTKIQVPTFYALGDTRLPVLASATAVGLKIAASLILIRMLPQYGIDPFLGLAISTSVAAWTNFALLAFGIKRRVGTLSGRGIGSTVAKMTVLSATMGVVCHELHRTIEAAWNGFGIVGEVARVLVVVAVGMTIVAVGAKLLGVHEARLVFDRIRRRLLG